MNILNENDLRYLAGFFDGDGSIIAKFIYHKDYVKTRPYQISLTVQFTQSIKRRWFLEQIRDLVGEGNVRDRKNGEVADYCIVGAAATERFLKQLKPYLRLKTKQANLLIRITEQLPHSQDPEKFFELCYLVDQIANLNDSKTRTITAEVVINTMKEALKEIDPVETEE